MFQIPKESHVAHVSLKVAKLELMRDYYQQVMGLVVRQESKNEVRLGTATQDLVILKDHPQGQVAPRRSGLYHLALLLPDRSSLASWLRRFLSLGQKLEGTGDHKVSEALYFSDPEGNGIEVYADRPQAMWQWEGEQVKLATDPLDLQNLMRAASQTPMTQVPNTAKIGHAHLKVADIEKTRAFYLDILGFNLMSDMSRVGALFVAAGNYHHHIGLNTWHSKNTLADPEALGLDHVKFVVPDFKTIEKLAHRMEVASYPFAFVNDQIEFDDPSKNSLVFAVSN